MPGAEDERVQQTDGHADETRVQQTGVGQAGQVDKGEGEGGRRRPATVVLALFRKEWKLPGAGK